jgi:hypothetical protein
MNASQMIPREEPKYLSVNDLVAAIAQDSQASDEPALREAELNAQIRIIDLLSQTGLVRIPGIVYGALLVERDRFIDIGNETGGSHNE